MLTPRRNLTGPANGGRCGDGHVGYNVTPLDEGTYCEQQVILR